MRFGCQLSVIERVRLDIPPVMSRYGRPTPDMAVAPTPEGADATVSLKVLS